MFSSMVLISYALSALASPVLLREGGAGNGTLSEDIMVLNKHGALETIKQNDWLASLKAAGVLLEKPSVDETYLNASSVSVPTFSTNETLSKRQASCDRTYAIITDTTQRFVDWDVQMSPVVCAVGDMDINVMRGYTVANSVSVNGGGSATLIANRLSAQFGVSFSRTWTTQDSITTKGTVKDGNCGVMITRPLVTRRYGRTMQGCPGSYKQIGTWMADAHGEGSYAGIDWVSGAISMCTKRQAAPPLSRCHGAGEFV
ncbi:hypothetical protein QM012_003986 [Aureobasidium pullulans]|uniref:Uncharacterized protein n=1 Tax=Aureobasidium pullulans TaxID=5580 RepID=A0ABR0T6D3_AURPU